jgi:hypothetical protein
MTDPQFEYLRLCAAVKNMLSAMEEADKNKLMQSKKMHAIKLKKEVIELMNPEKRIATQAAMEWEGR